MEKIFADTFYWIALINPRDDWHQRVVALTEKLDRIQIVTTDEILTEILNFLSCYGRSTRYRSTQIIQKMIFDPNIQIIPQTHSSFLQGLELYENRLDKEYSLTDCISMQIMAQMGITKILTHDKHFTQEGFDILFLERS